MVGRQDFFAEAALGRPRFPHAQRVGRAFGADGPARAAVGRSSHPGSSVVGRGLCVGGWTGGGFHSFWGLVMING